MKLDPTRYPTQSRAKKAVRRGTVLLVDAEKSESLSVLDTRSVVHLGQTLGLQLRLGRGAYPGIPFDRPNWDLTVVYQDDYMAVVNKPGGVECYSKGNGGHGRQTLRSALPYALWPPSPGIKEAFSPHSILAPPRE